jgi:phasin family protein
MSTTDNKVTKLKTVKAKPKAKAPQTADAKKQSRKTTGNKKQTTNFMETIMTAKTYDFDKITKDATAGSQELFGAMQKSMNIWAKGVEKMNQEAVALAQDIANKNQEAFKTIIACKDVNELTELQNKLTQKHFDTIVSSATKLSEISVKIATDSFEPINDQINKAVKKTTESVAA